MARQPPEIETLVASTRIDRVNIDQEYATWMDGLNWRGMEGQKSNSDGDARGSAKTSGRRTGASAQFAVNIHSTFASTTTIQSSKTARKQHNNGVTTILGLMALVDSGRVGHPVSLRPRKRSLFLHG